MLHKFTLFLLLAQRYIKRLTSLSLHDHVRSSCNTPRFRSLHEKYAKEWLYNVEETEEKQLFLKAAATLPCTLLTVDNKKAMHAHESNVCCFYLVDIDEDLASVTLWSFLSTLQALPIHKEVYLYKALQHNVNSYRNEKNGKRGFFFDARHFML